MAFSASWDRKRMASNRALTGTVPDARHDGTYDHGTLYDDNPGPESWASMVPDVGVGPMEGERSVYADNIGEGGPIDYTPVDHTTGDGVGAGLDPEQSAAENAMWRDTDFNATAARRWQAPADVDGHNVAERLTTQDPGENWIGSVNTVMLRVGQNKEAYPNTRPGWRIHRWRDRSFWRIAWQTDHRPLYTPNAFYTGVNRPAGDSQYVSPFPSQGHVNTILEKAPQLRRVPQPWGDAVMTDGYEVASESLDVWGQ